MLNRYLVHEKLLIRFISLFIFVLVCFLAAWLLSYFFLPEGVLLGRTAAQKLAGEDLAGGSVWLEWARIFAINFFVMLMSIVAPNLLRMPGNYPLGYLSTTLMAMSYGITLGTNSFTIPMDEKLAPTFAVLGRSGIYEILAYILASAATVTISRYHIVGKWPKQTIEPMEIQPSKTEIRERNLGFLAAVVILASACGWEAFRIAQALL